MKTFNEPSSDASTESSWVTIVGDWGHGIGPSIAFFNPGRSSTRSGQRTFFLSSSSLHAGRGGVEEGAHPLEDDAIVTARGIEWVYPVTRYHLGQVG